ncbi:natural killer cells antigen CD94-like isoform X1 [Callorhinus ursinus]|uniref:Natural killer cells antigen CD94-like n=1 Tax=Callorhinus ursinus TaxID=34884 RepID=A0A3Q7PZK3_CALUR|nr:natural killer cells antigen CD94-like [Callorhinus ursinus]
MSEERVTYMNLKLPYSRKQKGERCPMNRRREFPWHIVALSLGVICVIFLLTITGLINMLFQRCSGNTMQDMKDIKDKNASFAEFEGHLILPSITDKDYISLEEKMSCCGRSCYYFSKEEKTWERSKESCQDMRSSLIGIDNKEEQNFIQSKIKYNYWIGLYKVGAKHPWKWLDDTLLSQMVHLQQNLPDIKCGFLNSSNIFSADCSKRFRYICEKEFTGHDN